MQRGRQNLVECKVEIGKCDDDTRKRVDAGVSISVVA
jgi:hypothetical protein